MEESTRWSEASGSRDGDRRRGCLLAAACGDALGAPFEGGGSIPESELVAWEEAEAGAALRYTDDTALLLSLAAHLSERGEDARLDEDRLARDFARTWEWEPWRGYGAGATRVLADISAGIPWRESAGGLFDGAGSFGNGGAMRVAPVGLLPVPMSHVAELARRSASVTHAHPLAGDGAALQACAVAYAYHSAAEQRLDVEHFLTTVSGHVTRPEFTERLERLGRLFRDTPTPRAVAAELGNGISALEAVPAALAAFVHAPDDPRACLRFAVLTGGDTDTIAAMAGAVVGARDGAGALPRSWMARLERCEFIGELADRLAR